MTRFRVRTSLILLFVTLIILDVLLAWPTVDLTVSSWFYQPDTGFFLANHPAFLLLHEIAVKGSWVLTAFLLFAAIFTALKHKPLWTLDTKSWLFLFWGMALAPGLIANYGLKDHWGRARPREVVEFGGTASFSAALEPQKNIRKNGSFISGDGAFGFYLSAFAYCIPLRLKRKLSRRVFWSGIGIGMLFSFIRIAMGGHFLSDTLFAAFLMLSAMAVLHTVMYGPKLTRDYWREWLFQVKKGD